MQLARTPPEMLSEFASFTRIQAHMRKSSDFVDTGTMVPIKEPYPQMDTKDNWYIRVDHITDVVILDDSVD